MNDFDQNPTGYTHLLSPARLGSLDLPNRIVMAPLTRNRASMDGVPGELNALYYAQRAGAAFIISEAIAVSAQGVGYPAMPGLFTEAQTHGWRLVTDAVHAAGGRIFAQAFHCGRISHPDLQPGKATPVAPSAIKPAGEAVTPSGMQPFVTPRELSTDEVSGVVQDFADAVRRAVAAGFDGIEIHAANGYLIDQFLRDGTNHRTDRYGGSLENRTAFLNEVIEAVRGAWPAERIGVRLSPTGDFNDMSDSAPRETFGCAAEVVARHGLGYLHVIEDGPGTAEQASFDFSALRRAFPGTYIAAGGFTPESAERHLQSGRADLIAFGRAFIANPDLPARIARQAPLAEPDPATFYGGDAHGYTDYPSLEAEAAS